MAGDAGAASFEAPAAASPNIPFNFEVGVTVAAADPAADPAASPTSSAGPAGHAGPAGPGHPEEGRIRGEALLAEVSGRGRVEARLTLHARDAQSTRRFVDADERG